MIINELVDEIFDSPIRPRRTPAKLKKYSKDQPRDEQGRWTGLGHVPGGFSPDEAFDAGAVHDGHYRVFHGSMKNADQIRAQGLNARQDMSPQWFTLTTSRQSAERYANGGEVLTFNVPIKHLAETLWPGQDDFYGNPNPRQRTDKGRQHALRASLPKEWLVDDLPGGVLEGAVPEADRPVISATLARLTERYPIGEVRVKFASGNDAITKYANAQHGDPANHGQVIHVNAEEWAKQASTREKEMQPYLVDSSQPSGTLIHEYGHLVYNHLTKTLGPDGKAELQRIIDTGGGAGTQHFGQFDIPSVYSSESNYEMAAELFAAHVAQHFDSGRGFDNPYGPKAVERVRAYEKLLTKVFG